ncbi:MAG: NAD-dependent epimerase/dehydratase family protein [Legionella sp.]|nr:MAG: NAD-dependent epimerase/dehydratase family protein [Legionella sp.]
MYKILITGATGYVGRSLVPVLLSAGYQVRCAVSKKVDWLDAEQLVINRLELQTNWEEALKEVDIVIHLASRVHIMNESSASNLDTYCKVNSEATKVLAEQAARLKVKRFIFISTIKVNGDYTVASSPFTEDSKVNPGDSYAISKLLAEQHLLSISKSTGMEVVILRPPLIIGPNVKANFLKFLKLADKDWILPFGQINNARSFVCIDNLISAITTVIEHPKAANQTYLVADDDSWSLTSLFKFLSLEMGSKTRLFKIPGIELLFKLPGLNKIGIRLFGSLEVSNNKLKNQLGWTPPVRSAEGLAKTVRWYKSEYGS